MKENTISLVNQYHNACSHAETELSLVIHASTCNYIHLLQLLVTCHQFGVVYQGVHWLYQWSDIETQLAGSDSYQL